MKIAITGHSAGIGKALAAEYARDGHEIVGLSKRDGNNIRNVPKIADMIEPCDVFINNAQAGYSQTELLYEVANRWQGTKKHIIVISSILAQIPICPIPGLDMNQYRVQKVALEEAARQIRWLKLGINITIVRPGDIATQDHKTVPPAADVDNWAKSLVDMFRMADANNLVIPEIALGPKL